MMKKKLILFLAVVLCFGTSSKAQNYKFGKVSKEELLEKTCAIDSLAEAAFLYKSESISINYNTISRSFEKVIDYHIRLKIYDKDGLSYGNQNIYYYSGSTPDRIFKIKAVTYNLKNGKIVEQKVNKKEIYTEAKSKTLSVRKIAFPDVRAGSIIELKYSLTSNFWDIGTFNIQEKIPVKKLYYRTEIPEFFKYKKVTKGYYTVTPKTESTSERINQYITYDKEILTFEDKNIPAIKNDEPYTSNFNDYRGRILYELSSVVFPDGYTKTYSNSWESVCERLFESYSFGKQLAKKNYFKEDLEKITANTSSEKEKIESIFDFVKSKIQWNKHYGLYTNDGLPKAYKKGEGNIAEVNLTLVAMLKEAGIRAYPVLLSTKNNGVPIFPTLDGLNYVVAAVKNINGEILLLDASGQNNAVNVLPTRALNWHGRLMANKKTNIDVPLVPKQQSEEIYMAQITFDKDFKMSGNLRAKLTRKRALDFRNKYNKLGEEELKKKLGNRYHVFVKNCQLTNKKKTSKPIMLLGEVSSKKYCETINGKKYINPMVFLSDTKNPFKLDKRKYPIDLVTPTKISKNIILTIPKGYKVVSLPKSFRATMQNKTGSYSYLIQQNGNSISVKSVREFKTHMIPTSEYQEFKAFYKHMVAKNKEKIVLEKIEPVASAH